MTKPTLVVALGGNALLRRGEPLEASIQRNNIQQAAETLSALCQQWRVVLVHGNGPQVGLLALQNSAYTAVSPYPLDILVAQTQGMIGYLLQQALKNCLPEIRVCTLLTQVEISPLDPAFNHPTKYIGPVYTREQSAALAAEKGWAMKADGQHFRRVVASPQPLSIIETDAINTLLKDGHLVICNGGGGVPVCKTADRLEGAEAVIDKDLSAALLARQLHADALLILTDADAVYLDWGKPTQRPLHQTTTRDLAGMTFDAGSMGPKITAACQFVDACHGLAGIGALTDGEAILAGLKGTCIRAS
ncbi:carbamate kinase [Rahnella selenatireducens]|uniref:carbamate kinase n=1 Tax=Rahnella selenatireducens TaxID=3389797 RepID=UPI003968C751